MGKFNFAEAGVVGGDLHYTAIQSQEAHTRDVMALVGHVTGIIRKANGYKDDKGNETSGYKTFLATFYQRTAEKMGLKMEDVKARPSTKAWLAAARLAYDSGFTADKTAKFASIDEMRADKATKKRDKAKVGGRPAKAATEKVREYLTKMLPELNGNERRAVLVWFANECRIKATIEAPVAE